MNVVTITEVGDLSGKGSVGLSNNIMIIEIIVIVLILHHMMKDYVINKRNYTIGNRKLTQ